MGLSNTKEEQLKKQPIIESRVFRSADGKFIVQKTTISHIKPVQYYEAIMENSELLVDEE